MHLILQSLTHVIRQNKKHLFTHLLLQSLTHVIRQNKKHIFTHLLLQFLTHDIRQNKRHYEEQEACAASKQCNDLAADLQKALQRAADMRLAGMRYAGTITEVPDDELDD